MSKTLNLVMDIWMWQWWRKKGETIAEYMLGYARAKGNHER